MGMTKNTFPCVPECECKPVTQTCTNCFTRMAVEKSSIDELVHEPQYSATDAPSDYIKQKIVDSAIIVARDLGVLKRKVNIDIQKGVKDYYICPEDEEGWLQLQSICICGDCIPLGVKPCCDSPCQCSLARYGWFEAPDKVTLSWIPNRDIPNGIIVELTAIPLRGACNLDTYFMERYGHAIQTKALALMRMDKGGKTPHTWYEPNLAKLLNQEYERDYMGRHKIDIARQNFVFDYMGPG